MELELIHKKFLTCSSVTFDSRQVTDGSFFIALVGENTDGNNYIEQALNAGATCCLISNIPQNERYKQEEKCILVDDTLKVFQQLAAFHRLQFRIPVISIGGSNGKTTTKELVASVLSKKYRVHKTEGSFNNHTGVPLTLLSLKPEHEIAIIEIGANHLHEHEELVPLVKPTHLLITNNGKDHLEGFGDEAGARLANNELYAFAKTSGTAKIFLDIAHKDQVSDLKEMSFPESEIIGFGDDYSIASTSSATGLGVELVYGNDDDQVFPTQLVGNYNSENIAASIYIGQYFGVEDYKIKEALSEYVPGKLRSMLLEKDSMTLFVDCYNANPSSMHASLSSFLQTSKQPRAVILADMRELGAHAEAEHQEMTNYLISQKEKGEFDLCILVGPEFMKTTRLETATRFETTEEALLLVQKLLQEKKLENYSILFKGSRGPNPHCPILLPLVEEIYGEKVYNK